MLPALGELKGLERLAYDAYILLAEEWRKGAPREQILERINAGPKNPYLLGAYSFTNFQNTHEAFHECTVWAVKGEADPVPSQSVGPGSAVGVPSGGRPGPPATGPGKPRTKQ